MSADKEYLAALLKKAKSHEQAKQFAEALAALEEYLSLVPEGQSDMRWRAQLLCSLGRHEEALPLIEECIARSSKIDRMDNLIGQAVTLKAMGRYKAAIEALDEVDHTLDAIQRLADDIRREIVEETTIKLVKT